MSRNGTYPLIERQFRSDLEEKGFVFNNCDPCAANKQVHGKQHTMQFHVDDAMSSHEDKNVNAAFGEWLNDECGKHKPVELTRGKKHDFLGMKFDFVEKITNILRTAKGSNSRDYKIMLCNQLFKIIPTP